MPIQVARQKAFQRDVLFVNGRGHADERRVRRAHVFDRGNARLDEATLRFLDEVIDDRADHAADDFVNEATVLELRIAAAHGLVLRVEQRLLAQLVERQQPGAVAVVNVVVVVGDRIGDVGYLRLEARLPALQEALANVPELTRVALRAVLEDAFARLEHEVETREIGVLRLELIDDSQRLQVVLEASVVSHARIQRVLPGVAEGRVPEVVGETNGLGQRFIQAQGMRYRTADLGHL
jgi:hypothetical protein